MNTCIAAEISVPVPADLNLVVAQSNTDYGESQLSSAIVKQGPSATSIAIGVKRLTYSLKIDRSETDSQPRVGCALVVNARIRTYALCFHQSKSDITELEPQLVAPSKYTSQEVGLRVPE